MPKSARDPRDRERRPPSSEGDEPPSERDSSPVLADDRPSGEHPASKPGNERPAITQAVLRAYLGRPETQRELRNVVAAALGDRATRDLVGELANEAQLAALTAEQLAESEESLPAWLHGVARNKVREYFAAERVLRRRTVSMDDVQSLEDRAEQAEQRAEDEGAAAPAAGPEVLLASDGDGDGEEPAWLLSHWLRDRIRHDPQDRELVDILREKAKTKKTYDEIARERGTTPAAIYQRIYRLRQKHEGPWREYRRKRDLGLAVLLLLAVALLAVLAVRLWPRLRGPRVEPIGPDSCRPRLHRRASRLRRRRSRWRCRRRATRPRRRRTAASRCCPRRRACPTSRCGDGSSWGFTHRTRGLARWRTHPPGSHRDAPRLP